ncbi:DNA polymerase III subunit alpha [Lentibacillus halophilus]|uniref:DNA polymerase III subunit alpha n=1 Tax=Lentibacillus halophilus TaxID=295065 RepID=A0ABN0Z328_9BACI
MSFTHLQVRSGYSFMKSTMTVDRLVSKARELQFGALALTDEDVLHGVIPFYKACRQNGIKPIIGMSVTVNNAEDGSDMCVILAKNNDGYKNLVKISTHVQMSGENGISKEDLEPMSDDLICILVTAVSDIGSLLQHETYDRVKTYLNDEWRMFYSEDLYLGVQDHGAETERRVNQSVQAFCDKYSFPAVLLQDVRYLHENDDFAYDCLQAIAKGQTWQMKITDSSVQNRHMRSQEEMKEGIGGSWPEVIHETERITERCNVTFDFNRNMLPSYPVPEPMHTHTYLKEVCWENVFATYDSVTHTVKERLAHELEVIESMEFSDYFLIVWDFITYAKKKRIFVGPGRGSAAGSIVAYVLGITDVDPISHGLLFERFLNPERTSMPDIDIDFSDHRRDEVIDYVRSKYGSNHVAQIITFGTFSARALLRELIKTMQVESHDARFLLQAIPVQANHTIATYVRSSNDLQQYIKQSEKLKMLVAVATKLEGIPRHMSTHAAGVVISDAPLMETVPLTAGTNHTNLTQFAMNDLEALGLLKMDFLGLRNLTLMERITRTIRYTEGDNVSLASIPDDDPETYTLLQQGRTNGVFQLESQGMKEVLRRLKPTVFEEIAAVNALYRPGPMEQIPVYINRKHGTEQVTYPHPDLEPILKKTYGVLIYQEQIMQIAHRIANLSMGHADLLRRAVSKKDEQLMNQQRVAFIQGCLDNGYSQQVADEIFEWIVQFSNYGFNKSHAVAYSKISYQLAYLKAHYPASFFAELLTSVSSQQDKVTMYRKELETLGMPLLPPSINKSFGKYVVEGSGIRMGFLSIKGIGHQAGKEIIQVRKQGQFKSLFDFCMRVSQQTVNRQVLETLVMAGAFDDVYPNRAGLLASIDHALEQGELFKEFSDQSNLFQDTIQLEETYVNIEDFSLMRKLQDEKELLGFYMSSHPLKKFRRALQQAGYTSLSRAKHMPPGARNLSGAAVVHTMKVIRTKRGDTMAFMTVGDETDEIETVVFPPLYRQVNRWLSEEMVITFNGKVEDRNGQRQWIMNDVQPFSQTEWEQKQHQRLFIQLTDTNDSEALATIRSVAKDYPGNTPIIIYQQTEKKAYQLSGEYGVDPQARCLQMLRDRFGSQNVALDERKTTG